MKQFGKFEGLRVVEIGVGPESNAALFAKRGSTVTLLDYSDAALQRSVQLFDRFGLKVNTLYANALELPRKLLATFDVAVSFGLAEHFQGEERDLINKAHFDLVRPGGLVFIAVPNRNNPPYRILKYLAGKQRTRSPGADSAYSRVELDEICKRTGVSNYEFFGGSFVESLQVLNPFKKGRLRSLMRLASNTNDSETHFKSQRGSALDAALGKSIVLCGHKTSERIRNAPPALIVGHDADKRASLASMH